MDLLHRTFLPLIAITCICFPAVEVRADSGRSTRVDQFERPIPTGEVLFFHLAYRKKCDYVLDELDLKPGEVVVDIGAGDGWWSSKMAERVGPTGTVHAADISKKAIRMMKKRHAKVPQLKPYLCSTKGPDLPENSCDLAFISKTYHHLPKDDRVGYMRRLRSAIKPTGRLVIVEYYRELGVGISATHSYSPGQLALQAEEAGWTLLRCEMINGTRHFMAVFVNREIFPVEKLKQKPKKPVVKPKPQNPEIPNP